MQWCSWRCIADPKVQMISRHAERTRIKNRKSVRSITGSFLFRICLSAQLWHFSFSAPQYMWQSMAFKLMCYNSSHKEQLKFSVQISDSGEVHEFFRVNQMTTPVSYSHQQCAAVWFCPPSTLSYLPWIEVMQNQDESLQATPVTMQSDCIPISDKYPNRHLT